MKKFKDLKVGDIVFIDFEKKTVTKIIPNNGRGPITIYVSDRESYDVPGHLSTDYYYGIGWIFTNKKAIIRCLSETLNCLEMEHEKHTSPYKKWLEKAKQLED